MHLLAPIAVLPALLVALLVRVLAGNALAQGALLAGEAYARAVPLAGVLAGDPLARAALPVAKA